MHDFTSDGELVPNRTCGPSIVKSNEIHLQPMITKCKSCLINCKVPPTYIYMYIVLSATKAYSLQVPLLFKIIVSNVQVSGGPPSYEQLKITLELCCVSSKDVTQLTLRLSPSIKQSPNKTGATS